MILEKCLEFSSSPGHATDCILTTGLAVFFQRDSEARILVSQFRLLQPNSRLQNNRTSFLCSRGQTPTARVQVDLGSGEYYVLTHRKAMSSHDRKDRKDSRPSYTKVPSFS